MFLNNDAHTKIIKKNSCVKRKWTLFISYYKLI